LAPVVVRSFSRTSRLLNLFRLLLLRFLLGFEIGQSKNKSTIRGLLEAIGNALATYIESQPEDSQLAIAITMVMWVSAIVSAFLDNIPYTATMIPVVQILADKLPTVDLATLAWSLAFGACLGGNGTLLGASANIVSKFHSPSRAHSLCSLGCVDLTEILSLFITPQQRCTKQRLVFRRIKASIFRFLTFCILESL